MNNPFTSVADLVITIAYFSIPLQIVAALCQYPRIAGKTFVSTKIVILLILFALFIFLCGAGHLLRCLGRGDTKMFIVVNNLTAIISLATAVYLLPLIPNLLHDLDKSLLLLSRSSRIVDSLFPARYRDRLFKANSSRRMSGCGSSNSVDLGCNSIGNIGDDSGRTSLLGDNAIVKMNKFLRKLRKNPADFDVSANSDGQGGVVVSEPIAENFPSVTIMFADIVGFTSWSAQQNPDDVFTLLEELFWEFDELALKYGIFKLGTIGDCYLAVCGLPDPCNDHAIILSKFAEECRRKMNEVRDSLVDKLGNSTKRLSMRFGLHSGSITAGILRGHKSRFELFGDTINTASRMESTGLPDRIQVSQETADLLTDGGEESWLVQRDCRMNIKGKGQMQTYWLQVRLPDDNGDNTDAGCQELSVDIESQGHQIPLWKDNVKAVNSCSRHFDLDSTLSSYHSEEFQNEEKIQGGLYQYSAANPCHAMFTYETLWPGRNAHYIEGKGETVRYRYQVIV